MVNSGKEIENDKKSDHAWPYSLILTLTLPWICFIQNNDKKWSNIKEIKTWKVANRLWNGKMIKKWPMLKANSVIRAKNKVNVRSSHIVIWTNEIPTVLQLFWAKRKQQEKQTKVSVQAAKII